MKFSLLSICALLATNIFSQNYKSCYCKLQKKHLQPATQIYENKVDTLIKIYYQNLNLVESSLLNRASLEDSQRTDTVTWEYPLNRIIDKNDRLVILSNFTLIKLKEYGQEPDVILFERRIDFMGDKGLDKLEILTADEKSRGRKSYALQLYENKAGKFIPLEQAILLGEKPLKMYVSSVKYLDMAVLMFICEDDDEENSQFFYLISASKINF